MRFVSLLRLLFGRFMYCAKYTSEFSVEQHGMKYVFFFFKCCCFVYGQWNIGGYQLVNCVLQTYGSLSCPRTFAIRQGRFGIGNLPMMKWLLPKSSTHSLRSATTIQCKQFRKHTKQFPSMDKRLGTLVNSSFESAIK